MTMEYLIFADTEATDLPENNGELIEICLLKVRQSDLLEVDMFHTRLKPSIKLRPVVTNVTGISNRDLAKSPSFRDVHKRLSSFVGGNPIFTKMVEFETAILNNTLSILEINCELDHVSFVEMEDIEKRLGLTSHSNDNVADILGMETPDGLVSTCKFYCDVYRRAHL